LTPESPRITFLQSVILDHHHDHDHREGPSNAAEKVRDAVGLKPGDKVDIRATASGGIYIEKPGALRSYGERLDALAKRRPIRGITTDELMEFSRGEVPVTRTKKK
jgi:antitoxin PrlF